MSDSTILISSVCGDIGAAAVRALADADVRIVGCDMKVDCPVMSLMDAFYQAPAARDEDRYKVFIEELIKKEHISFFLPISEPELEVLNPWREEIENRDVGLMMNNRFIIDTFLDKLKTVQYLEQLKIRTPVSVPLKDYDGQHPVYPVIVKTRKGYGSKRKWKIEDAADLEYIRRKDDGTFLVQEYVGSEEEEYTTGVFSDGNRVSTITFRRRLGFGGLSIEASLVEEPFLDRMAEEVARETQLMGSINIQSRRSGDIFVPLEINPRLSSTLSFRKTFGFDDVRWWLDALRGRFHSYRKKYKSGTALRYLSECYFRMEEADNDHR